MCNDADAGVTFCRNRRACVDLSSVSRLCATRDLDIVRKNFPNALLHTPPRDTLVAREMDEYVGDACIEV